MLKLISLININFDMQSTKNTNADQLLQQLNICRLMEIKKLQSFLMLIDNIRNFQKLIDLRIDKDYQLYKIFNIDEQAIYVNDIGKYTWTGKGDRQSCFYK